MTKEKECLVWFTMSIVTVFGAKASSSMQSEPHNTSGSSLHVALPEHEKLTLTSKQRDSETE